MKIGPTLTAREMVEGFRKGTFSPVEMLDFLLKRIDVLDPVLNSFYLTSAQEARRMAEASSSRWRRGEPLSQLDGVPTSIKDALSSVGHPSYRGSLAHSADRQHFNVDAPTVARMREAGMVFLGKTTMPDFGIFASGLSSKHGITRNPWDLTKTPGGSSAGTAASIAAGLNPLAVGTDIVGSIRLPASFCGIFGFKPSQGRVPYHFPNSPSLVAGPMARSVDDAALLMNIISQPDSRDFSALPFEHIRYDLVLSESVVSPRIGFIRDLGFGGLPDPEVIGSVSHAVEKLRGTGLRITDLDVSFSEDDLRAAERFYKARARAELVQFPEDRRKSASVLSEWSAEAEGQTAVDLYRDFNRLQSMRERTAALIADFDFLILPSVHVPAFEADAPGLPHGRLFEPWINSFLFNLSEQPASSSPCGLTKAGLPIGLQIVGRRFADIDVFRLSKIVEDVFGWRKTLDEMTDNLPTRKEAPWVEKQ
ncbi:amidase [Aminobacter aminovorans]|uniref:Amidase n=1 Tax=Aminobacter aminovorans TaxID=83263 RepID=A0AAC8YWD8_AMIAI|nr:amidase [Aminobacter aminovorans]AMS45488.1 Amidase [Aminobacter aminovorans]MBB3708696.1 Asp-tRNA(Asn)/Glu-tRNA(Gln) amidotransferase A subunit family amidase [Aminobacter aminovorans]